MTYLEYQYLLDTTNEKDLKVVGTAFFFNFFASIILYNDHFNTFYRKRYFLRIHMPYEKVTKTKFGKLNQFEKVFNVVVNNPKFFVRNPALKFNFYRFYYYDLRLTKVEHVTDEKINYFIHFFRLKNFPMNNYLRNKVRQFYRGDYTIKQMEKYLVKIFYRRTKPIYCDELFNLLWLLRNKKEKLEQVKNLDKLFPVIYKQIINPF